MTGDCHVQFGERLAGKFRWPTQLDFRVIAKSPCLDLGQSAKRRELRLFRHSLVESLVNAGFDVQAQNIKVFYEGRYMSIRASFEGAQGIVYNKHPNYKRTNEYELQLTYKLTPLDEEIKPSIIYLYLNSENFLEYGLIDENGEIKRLRLFDS
ncbi:hypothetical protein [Legionella israelensis]|uniref:hypothetical protein n=1 Tax=Legionella israelensis TaxID=454 RepID=UPI001FD7BF99|nr:hypothetical protein [Legionella israelensis]